LKKPAPPKPPSGKSSSADKSVEISRSSKRFLETMAAQIDAIKAERDRQAEEPRRPSRQPKGSKKE